MKSKSRSAGREAFLRKVRKIYVTEFFEAIAAAIVIAVLLRVFVVSVYRVPTESMRPALIPGDFIVGFKTSYGLKIPFTDQAIGRRDPKRGDVVIFEQADAGLFIKRVVGIPGDRIEIRDGKLSINELIVSSERSRSGEWDLMDESFGGSTHRVMIHRERAEADFLAPQVVPPGHVFLLGDLRSDSIDSRHWGPISIDQIEARASFIGMSLRIRGQDDGNVVPEGRIRFDRIFKTIE